MTKWPIFLCKFYFYAMKCNFHRHVWDKRSNSIIYYEFSCLFYELDNNVYLHHCHVNWVHLFHFHKNSWTMQSNILFIAFLFLTVSFIGCQNSESFRVDCLPDRKEKTFYLKKNNQIKKCSEMKIGFQRHLFFNL